MTKKKEELAVGKDIGIEKWSTDIDEQVKDSINMEFKWRINAQVIDSPTQYRLTKPKMVDPVMNVLCYMMTGKSLEELDNE